MNTASGVHYRILPQKKWKNKSDKHFFENIIIVFFFEKKTKTCRNKHLDFLSKNVENTFSNKNTENNFFWKNNIEIGPTLPKPVQEWCIADTNLIQADADQNETGNISCGRLSFEVVYKNMAKGFQN